ncbi:unnamed protein product [Notodromas monacha]|uniref:phenylalanine--tRNA ligase n=1 Tax=Notodromas monacha TaxID=399045 RepID=A0A7R9BPE2_9CRUS|nr:unnamed protein product [Notodromas monacha]CAG0918167.1 unnamed protein product [Notodromas monacha]
MTATGERDLPQELLSLIAKENHVSSLIAAEKLGVDHQRVVGAVKSLQSLDGFIVAEQSSSKTWSLTSEGQMVKDEGSHEARVFRAVPEEGISMPELMKLVPANIGKIGVSKALSSGWILMDKTGGGVIKRKIPDVEDTVQHLLEDLSQASEAQKADLKKRKLVIETVLKFYEISQGPNFSLNITKPETELTAEMLSSGSWIGKSFKPLNFEAKGAPVTPGHLHPLMKVRADLRQIFLEMGFMEMPTNNYVESSFWNFDAVFQPQQHPARDAQDTFFLSDPEFARDPPLKYMEEVKKVHSIGGYGSQGYGYEWSEAESRKNVLRTHTTAVSARMLYRLAQDGFRPARYFSVDKVFRNETLDPTHLAEFCQIEGVVAEKGASLAMLMGIISKFFGKLGMKEIRFKPTSNPYTEPSMEVYSYHAGLGKWVEIGNSGVFRPEMLRPMGLDPEVRVLGWGLSLERPTMILYNIDNIRDLVGPKVDLQMVCDSPLCRLGRVEN